MTATNFRRTKILATLGPATDQPGVLAQISEAGANVVQIYTGLIYKGPELVREVALAIKKK